MERSLPGQTDPYILERLILVCREYKMTWIFYTTYLDWVIELRSLFPQSQILAGADPGGGPAHTVLDC